MNGSALSDNSARPGWRFYYGWINVFLASLAMSATLPGRTHGLGLITEPLLSDLQLERTQFAQINLWTSLLGAAFCLPIGWMIDRWGVRSMVTAVTLCLSVSVLWMSRVTDSVTLFATLVLVRGFGQSALSIISMAMIGKWFRRRVGIAMGLFAVLLTFGFIGGVLGMGDAVSRLGWRDAWSGLAYVLLGFVPLAWFLVRSVPSAQESIDEEPARNQVADPEIPPTATDFTFVQAITTPAFWVLVLGASAFNLVWSSVMLFNESILAERGFDTKTAVEIMAILTGTGLISNLVAGGLASRDRMLKILGIGLVVLAVALALFPSVTSSFQIRSYAAAMGLTGGMITVVFFAAWGHVFGRQHLGRIQSMAQLISVLASAIGPVFMAVCLASAGSYIPMFYMLAAMSGLIAVVTFIVPLPERSVVDWSQAIDQSSTQPIRFSPTLIMTEE